MKEIRIYIDDDLWYQWKIACLKHGGSRKTIKYMLEKEQPVSIRAR